MTPAVWLRSVVGWRTWSKGSWRMASRPIASAWPDPFWPILTHFGPFWGWVVRVVLRTWDEDPNWRKCFGLTPPKPDWMSAWIGIDMANISDGGMTIHQKKTQSFDHGTYVCSTKKDDPAQLGNLGSPLCRKKVTTYPHGFIFSELRWLRETNRFDVLIS